MLYFMALFKKTNITKNILTIHTYKLIPIYIYLKRKNIHINSIHIS